MRIALAKQVVYADLYNCPHDARGRDIAFTSNMRTGPVGLLCRYDVDFHILEVEHDPECSIWKQKVSDCRHGTEESYWAMREKAYRQADGSLRRHADFSTRAGDVDWSQYDVVICYDLAVPARITRNFPSVVWCYYITEPCMEEYRLSKLRPAPGYDLFLNQMFRSEEVMMLDPPAEHAVEFPYFLQYHGCFGEILGDEAPAGRSGIIIDPHLRRHLTDAHYAALEQFGPVHHVSGQVKTVMTNLLSSTIYLRLGSRAIWGNSSIEAVASGNIFVTSTRGYKIREFLRPQFTVSEVEFSDKQFSQALKVLEAVFAGGEEIERAVAWQRERVDHLCWRRPLADLASASARRGKNISFDAVLGAA